MRIHSAEDEAVNTYWDTEQKCRKYSKMVVTLFMGCVQFTYHTALWYSFYCVWDGNLDTSTWLMPFVLAMPFRTDTLLGWYAMWFFTSSMDFCYILCMSSITTYYVSTCVYIEAMRNHLKYVMRLVQEDVIRSQQDKSPQNYRKYQVQIMSHVRRAVEHHVQIFE